MTMRPRPPVTLLAVVLTILTSAVVGTRHRQMQAAITAGAACGGFAQRAQAVMGSCCPRGGGGGHRRAQAATADCPLPTTCPSQSCAAAFVDFFDNCQAFAASLPAADSTKYRSLRSSCGALLPPSPPSRPGFLCYVVASDFGLGCPADGSTGTYHTTSINPAPNVPRFRSASTCFQTRNQQVAAFLAALSIAGGFNARLLLHRPSLLSSCYLVRNVARGPAVTSTGGKGALAWSPLLTTLRHACASFADRCMDYWSCCCPPQVHKVLNSSNTHTLPCGFNSAHQSIRWLQTYHRAHHARCTSLVAQVP